MPPTGERSQNEVSQLRPVVEHAMHRHGLFLNHEGDGQATLEADDPQAGSNVRSELPTFRPNAQPSAEDLDSFEVALALAARRHEAWIVAGLPERATDRSGRTALHNAALVVSPEAVPAARYRKVLLYEADLAWAKPGWNRVVVPTPFGGLAPAICTDLNDDRFIRFLHVRQPSVVAFCTNWVQADPDPDALDTLAWWRWRLLGWSAGSSPPTPMAKTRAPASPAAPPSWARAARCSPGPGPLATRCWWRMSSWGPSRAEPDPPGPRGRVSRPGGQKFGSIAMSRSAELAERESPPSCTALARSSLPLALKVSIRSSMLRSSSYMSTDR